MVQGLVLGKGWPSALLGGASGSGQSYGTPDDNTLGYIGDSRLQAAGDDGGGTATAGVLGSSSSYGGPVQWLLKAVGHRIFHPRFANTAVGGQNTANVVSRLAAITALSPKTFLIELGRNDWSGTPLGYSTTLTNMETIFAAVRDAGKKLIVTNGLPETGLTGTLLSERQAYAAWLLNPQRRVDYPNIIAQLDLLTIMKDPATTFDFRAGDSPDGVHLTQQGARRYGEGLAPYLAQIYSAFPVYTVPTAASDAYNSGTNPTGVLTSNFLLTGTGGTKSGTNPATGSVPDSWDITNSEAGISIVSSIADGADGFKEWTITVTGTPTSAGARAFLVRRLDGTNAAALSAGDKVHSFAKVKVDASPTNLLSIGLGAALSGTGAAGSNPVTGATFVGQNGGPKIDAGFGFDVIRSQEAIADANWATMTSRQIRAQMQIQMQGQSAVNFAITVKQFGTRKTF